MADYTNRNVESELQPKHLEEGQSFKAKWKSKPAKWRHRVMAAAAVSLAVVIAVPLYALAEGNVPATGDFTGESALVVQSTYQLTYKNFDPEKPGNNGVEIETDEYGMGIPYGTNSPYTVPYDPDNYATYGAFYSNPSFYIVGYTFEGDWADGDFSSTYEYNASEPAEHNPLSGSEDLTLVGTWVKTQYNITLNSGTIMVAQLLNAAEWDSPVTFDAYDGQDNDFVQGEDYKGELSDFADFSFWASKDGKYGGALQGETLGAIVNRNKETDPSIVGPLDPYDPSVLPEDEDDEIVFDVELYPAYKVTLDSNGGTGAPDAIFAVETPGSNGYTYVATLLPDPEKNGEEFLGWTASTTVKNNATGGDIVGEDVESGTPTLFKQSDAVAITVASNVTLTAHWKPAGGKTYNYTVNVPGYGEISSDTPTPQTVATGETGTATVVPTKVNGTEAYNVIKWQHTTTPNNESSWTDIEDSATKTIHPANATYPDGTYFRAVLGFNVTYDFDDEGSFKDDDTAASYAITGATESQTFNLPGTGDVTAPTGENNEKYRLKGWTVGSTTKNPGDEVTITYNTTITPIWQEYKTFYYDACEQGTDNAYAALKSGQVASENVDTDSSGTIAITPAGKYNVQWQSSATGADGSWTNISGATAVTTSGTDVTYNPSGADFADGTHFRAYLDYDITFDCGTGASLKDSYSLSGLTDLQSNLASLTLPTAAQVNAPANMRLTGWSDGTDTYSLSGDIGTTVENINENTTFTAQWVPTKTFEYESSNIDYGTISSTTPEIVNQDTSGTGIVTLEDGYKVIGWKVKGGSNYINGTTGATTFNPSYSSYDNGTTFQAVLGFDIVIDCGEGASLTGYTPDYTLTDRVSTATEDLTLPTADQVSTSGKRLLEWSGSDGRTYQPGDKVSGIDKGITFSAVYQGTITYSYSSSNTTYGNVSRPSQSIDKLDDAKGHVEVTFEDADGDENTVDYKVIRWTAGGSNIADSENWTTFEPAYSTYGSSTAFQAVLGFDASFPASGEGWALSDASTFSQLNQTGPLSVALPKQDDFSTQPTGMTLTGWTDGTTTYNVKSDGTFDAVTVSYNKTFTPVWQYVYEYSTSNPSYGKVKLGESGTAANSVTDKFTTNPATAYADHTADYKVLYWTNGGNKIDGSDNAESYTPQETYASSTIQVVYGFDIDLACGESGGSISDSWTSGKQLTDLTSAYTNLKLPEANEVTPPAGMKLVGWMVDGTQQEPGYTVPSITKNATFTAVWNYVFNYEVNDSTYGKVSLVSASDAGAASATDSFAAGGTAATAYAVYNSTDYKVLKWQYYDDNESAWVNIDDSANLGSHTPPQNPNYDSTDYKIIYGFSATFDLNGGSINQSAETVYAPDTDNKTTATDYTLPTFAQITPANGNKRLTGWIDSDGYSYGTTGVLVEGVNKNTTFTAQYEDVVTYTYEVSNGNYGSLSKSSETIRTDASGSTNVTLTSGYNVIEWQYSTDNGSTWTPITNSANTTNFTPSATVYNTDTKFKAVLGFNVVIDYNGGAISGADKDETTFANQESPATVNFASYTPHRSGWVLRGWATSSTASPSGTLIALDGVENPGSNTTYYAIWDKQYDITYKTASVDDDDDTLMGTVKVNEQDAVAGNQVVETVYDTTSIQGATATVNKPNPATDYYEFVGWTVSQPRSANASILSADASYSPSSKQDGVTYFANFKHITASVTYDPGDTSKADFSADTHTVNRGDVVPAPTSSIMKASNQDVAKNKTGYTFAGWTSSVDITYTEDSTEKTIAAGTTIAPETFASVVKETYVVTQNITFTAVWNTNDGYAINFEYPELTASERAAVKVGAEGNLPLPDGRQSLAWGDAVFGEATNHTNTSALVVNSSYNGFKFGGWFADSKYETPVASNAVYSDIARNDDDTGYQTIYGKFTRDATTITFHSNFTDDGAVDQTVDQTNGVTNKPVTLAANTFTRYGYTFYGWTDLAHKTTAWDGDFEGKFYGDKTTFTPPAGTTDLYAVWKPTTYNIAFNGNGGTGSMEPINDVPYNATQKLTKNAFQYAGKIFEKWRTAATSGAGFGDEEEVEKLAAGGTVTLFAQWKDAFSVSYDANGGDIPEGNDYYDTVTLELGANHTVLAGEGHGLAAKDGCAFTGWNTDANGEGDSYAPGDYITSDTSKAITLYAQWSAADTRYEVKRYVKNGDAYELYDNSPYYKSTYKGAQAKVGKPVGAEDSDTPDGYVRNDSPGSVDPGVVTYVASAGADNNTDRSVIVLYFDPVGYVVEYKYTGDVPTGTPPALATYGAGETVTIAAQPTDVEGFTFVPETTGVNANGWSVSGLSAGDITAVDESTYTFSMPANKVTLTGKWERATYTVHYSGGEDGSVSAATEQVQYQRHPQGVTASKDGFYHTGWNQVDEDGNLVEGGEGVDPTSYSVTSNDLYFVATYAPQIAYAYQPGAHPYSKFATSGKENQYPLPVTVMSLSELAADMLASGDAATQAKGQALKDSLDGSGNPKAAAGYEFDSWEISNDGGETNPSSPYGAEINANYTFLAKYTALTHGVTINVPDANTTIANGAGYTKSSDTVWVKDADVATDDSLTLPGSGEISRPGYSLSGWTVTYNPVDEDGNVAGTATTQTYGATATFLMPAAENLTATPTWTALPTVITYEVDDEQGEITSNGETVKANGDPAPAGCTATPKAGYQFAGWVVTAGTDAKTNKGANKIVPELQDDGSYHAVTYKATFTPIQYTLTVSSESDEKGTATGEGITVPYGGKLTQDQIDSITNTPTSFYQKADIEWTYQRYDTNGDALGAEGNAATNDQLKGIVFEGNVTIVAHYKGKDVTVSFDNNGGSFTAQGATKYPNMTIEYGKSITLPSGDLARTGYSFAGWDEGSVSTGENATYGLSNLSVSSFKPASLNVTMYAHWNANEYTITYSPNGYQNMSGDTPTDINVPDQQTFLYSDSSVKVTAYTPTIDDPSLEFAGWDTNAAADGTRYQANASISPVPAGDFTLYAVFKTKEINITYLPGEYGVGGSMTPVTGGSVAAQTADYGATDYKIAANGFTITASPDNEYYTFDKWKGSDGKYYDADAVAHFASGLTEDLELTAQWKVQDNAPVYTLNFLNRDGDIERTAKVNLNGKLSEQTPVVDLATGPATGTRLDAGHFEFEGWAVSESNNATMITGDATYTSLYKAALGSSAAVPASVNLYPHDKVTSYTVSYDGNNASVSADSSVTGTAPAAQTFTYGDGTAASAKFAENPFKAPGYSFDGWDDDANATSGAFAENVLIGGDLVNKWGPAALTLYAIWSAEDYTVVYYDTDGSVLDDSHETVKWGDVLPTPTGTIKPVSGKTLTGWSLEDGSGAYNPGSDKLKDVAVNDYEEDGSKLSDYYELHLYPVMTLDADALELQFVASPAGTDASDLSTTSVTGVKDGKATIIDNKVKRAGYTPNGWNTAENGSGTAYADGAEYTFTGDERPLRLYSQWTQSSYIVKYDANYADAPAIAASKVVHWGESGLYAGITTPTRPGYTFAGWYDGPGTGDSVHEVTAAATYDTGETTSLATAEDVNGKIVTLYARWTENADYKVRYELSGGTYDGAALDDKTGVSWTGTGLIDGLDPSKLARTGYTAANPTFYMDSDCTQEVTASTQFNELVGGVEPNDKTGIVYVKWNENNVVIKYESSDPAHGAVTPASTTVKSATGTITVPGEVGVVAQGYVLKGWYDKDDDSKTIISGSEGSSTFTPTKSGALWVPKTYVAYIEPYDKTSYKVEHYKQNLNDDDFTMEPVVGKSGVTGTTATATSNTYEGFTFDSTIPGTKVSGEITGDGNLTLRLWYTRNKYNLTYAYSWTGDTAPASVTPLTTNNKTEQKFESAQKTIDAAPYTPAGWEFKGWKTSPSTLGAGGVLAANTDFTMPAANVVLTADMQRIKYDVTFALDDETQSDQHGSISGGTVSIPSGTKVSSSAYSVTPNAGYAVKNWKVVRTSDGTLLDTVSKPENYGGEDGITEAVTFKAVLSEKLTVTYSIGAHGAFADVENRTSYSGINPGTAFGSAYYFKGETDTSGENNGLPKAVVGWKFTGWKWGDEANQTNVGAVVAQPANLITADLDAKIGEMTDSVELVAQWQATEQTLTIDPDGGTWKVSTYEGVSVANDGTTGKGNPATKDLLTEASFKLPTSNDISRFGYELTGWTDSSGNEITGDSFSMTGVDNTIKPVWTPIMFTVTYARNIDAAGTLSRYSERLQQVDNGSIQGSTATAAHAGYVFDKWTVANSADDGGVEPTAEQATVSGAKLTPEEPILEGVTTFVANFNPVPQSVTFASNNTSYGTVTDGRDDGKKTALYNSTVTNFDDITVAANPGYKLDDDAPWKYSTTTIVGSDITNQPTTDPESVTILGPTTFTAQFVERDDFKVNYVVNGGSGVLQKTGVKWTEADIATASTTKLGYHFGGPTDAEKVWYLDAEFTKPAPAGNPTFAQLAAVVGAADVDAAGEITLYAKWVHKFGYSVNYDTDGGTNVQPTGEHHGSANTLTDLYWDDTGLDTAMTSPTKVGYLFDKWYKSDKSAAITSETMYADIAGGSDLQSSIPTVIAGYTVRPYDLNYDVNAPGVDSVAKQTVNWFDGITFATAPTRDGYEFAYWYYTDDEGAMHKCTNGETTLAEIVGGAANESVAIAGNATVHAKWLKIVDVTVYHHKWQHTVDGTISYDSLKWSDFTGSPDVTSGLEEDEIALEGIIGTFAGFKQFDLSDDEADAATAVGVVHQRVSGVLTANDADNRFDIYYKERHDYTVKYDFNLGDDEIHKPLDASGNEIAAIPDVSNQWWTDKGYFSAIEGVDMDQSRLGYDFVEWSTDQGVKSTSDDQHLYELLGNTAPLDTVNNNDVEDGIVSLKARWNEQTAEIEYLIDSASNGMGTVVQHVNNAVADDSGDVLSEDVLKYHGNDVMGATAVPNPGYHFVQWMVNVDLSQKISEQRAAAERASAGGDTGDNTGGDTGDNTGGDTGDNTGGDTGDNTGGDTGGNAGDNTGDGTGDTGSDAGDGSGTGDGTDDGTGDGTLGGQSVDDEAGIMLVAQADDDTWYVYPASANMTPGKDANQLYPAAAYKAEFAKSSYTIAYDANYSGAPAIGTKTTASWDAIGLLGTVADPVREGYTFDGWFTAPGGGKQVTKNSKYNNTDLAGATATLDGAEVDIDTNGATVTLYAHWTIIAPTNDELIQLIETGDKLDGDGTVTSADGSDVYKTAQWVPESVKKELEDALEQAKKVAADPNATPEDRIAAYDRLEEAINAYKAAKKYGTSSDTTAKGGPNSASGTKGTSKASTWKAPTTGDHLVDAMIVIGAVALVAAFILAFLLRRRERN